MNPYQQLAAKLAEKSRPEFDEAGARGCRRRLVCAGRRDRSQSLAIGGAVAGAVCVRGGNDGCNGDGPAPGTWHSSAAVVDAAGNERGASLRRAVVEQSWSPCRYADVVPERAGGRGVGACNVRQATGRAAKNYRYYGGSDG